MSVWARPGGYRFLPDGKGLVYLPRIHARGLLAARSGDEEDSVSSRGSPIQGTLRTFDITPDGSHIVFDRSRENSDIVLIDLPK